MTNDKQIKILRTNFNSENAELYLLRSWYYLNGEAQVYVIHIRLCVLTMRVAFLTYFHETWQNLLISKQQSKSRVFHP